MLLAAERNKYTEAECDNVTSESDLTRISCISGTKVNPLRALFLSTGLNGSRSGVEAPDPGSVCLHTGSDVTLLAPFTDKTKTDDSRHPDKAITGE